MASHLHARGSGDRRDRSVKAVLGPTNTGKTHLAIERLCAHSSGAIGFPLRLLAREVYDRVCKIKGENNPADMGTKALPRDPIERYARIAMQGFNQRTYDGVNDFI